MDKQFIERLELRLVSLTNKFNISSVFNFTDSECAKINRTTSTSNCDYKEAELIVANECGTAACIFGHAKLELQNANLRTQQFADLFFTAVDDRTFLLEVICGWDFILCAKFYNCARHNITAYQAANVLRYIRLNESLPANIDNCEVFYYKGMQL